MFNSFLVSSDVHQEKNSLSEAALILTKYIDIAFFEPKLLPIGGLGLLRLKNNQTLEFSEEIYDHIKKLHLNSGILYCLKIIPLEVFKEYKIT